MLAHTSVVVTFALTVLLVGVETMGPWLAETRKGGTPWHAHHIVERYGLLAIIALGEGVVGTVASLSAVIRAQGWTMDAVLVAVAGTGLTFGMWWVYFVVPAADLLHAHRERSFRYGYLHYVVIGSIVATGAGLHAAAYYIEHHSKLGSVETVLTVAIPVAAYIASVYLLYMLLVRTYDALPRALGGAHRGGADRRGGSGGPGRPDDVVPADRHAGADGDRGRIRTARAPTQTTRSPRVWPKADPGKSKT